MRKYLLLTILLSGLTLGARGQSDPEIDLSGLPQKTTASSLRYWFDADANSVKTASISGSATTIDASALKEGIHTVHYQIVDNKNIAGIPTSKIFIKVDPKIAATAKSLRYWYDDDANINTSTPLNGATTIDASTLREGIHTVHYQIVDSKGIASIPASKIFIKLDEKTATEAKSLRYWFDSGTNVNSTTTLSGATTIDASAIKEGIHTDWENADRIKKIVLYPSAKTEAGKLISLDEYVKAMPKDQKDIYFLSAERLEEARHSPQLEQALKHGCDVLFFVSTSRRATSSSAARRSRRPRRRRTRRRPPTSSRSSTP